MNESGKSNGRVRSSATVYAGAFALSLGVVTGAPYLAYYAGATHLASFLQLLWLPGLVLASVVFSGGIHSTDPANMNAYLGLSLLIASLLWMWPIVWIVGRVSARRAVRFP